MTCRKLDEPVPRYWCASDDFFFTTKADAVLHVLESGHSPVRLDYVTRLFDLFARWRGSLWQQIGTFWPGS